jgi:Na+/citrate or Na+/malate symporter
MADTGGSGDDSVLSAAGRMHLMPFAALTNRIGGALVLFVTSLLVPLLG